MKIKVLSLITFLAVSASSHAFVVATSNLVSPDAAGGLPVTTFAGSVIPVGEGSISVGYFSSIIDANLKSTAFVDLKANFVQLGTPLPFSNGFNAPGFFDVSVGGAIADVSSFIGKNVYIFMGNGTTVANSSDIAVWKGSLLFAADSNSPGGSVVLDQSSAATALLVGTDGGAENVLGINFGKSIQLANAPVPEPSAALLGALGALGLLRRRRN